MRWCAVLWVAAAAAQTVPGRYIVELAGEPVAGAAARVAARRAVERQGAVVVGQVDEVANALLVRVDDAEAPRLASLPGVKRVVPVRRLKRLLDHALPLHKVPEAWNRIGEDKAGAGMKVAIIDTGVEIEHPGMQDASLTAPQGYPKTNAESDVSFTNGKVIVARSYARLFEREDPDPSARDRVGHGTATAMAAAGARNTGPLGPIVGVAPKAWLGSYKVFGSAGVNDSTTSDVILKALDDAVKDGMDVISISIGSTAAPRIEDDIEVQAIERATQAGAIVVVSACNDGPDPNTIASPATAPSAIAVGASRNDRIFGAAAVIEGADPYLTVPGSGPSPREPLRAPLLDVEALDNNWMACRLLPAGSLQGRMALILRGVCTFEIKLNNAQAAGAVGALVYTDRERPDPPGMNVGAAALPAMAVSYANGVEIKQRLAERPDFEITLDFSLRAFKSDPNAVAGFSATGPSVDEAIKPDLVAVGTTFYTATQRSVREGDMFSPSGYAVVEGTSFSAPLVAGAAALLKGARPGLTPAQYRSLLVNTAAPLGTAQVQQAGGGTLDLDAALRSTVAAAPASLSFRSGDGNPQFSRTLAISNMGASAGEYTLKVVPLGETPAPQLGAESLTVAPGETAEVTVRFSAESLAAGQYQGHVAITDGATLQQTRVPYWYAVASAEPRYITILDAAASGDPSELLNDAILFRATDASGVVLLNVTPRVTAGSGGGRVVRFRSIHRAVPGAYSVDVRLGPGEGPYVFRIEIGELTKEVTIRQR